jgi:AraC-like DNA-binding protein
MKNNIPIYTDDEKTYYADTCRPIKKAVTEGKISLYSLKRGHYPGEQIAEGEIEGINTIGYWDITSPQDWGLPWHRNEGIEITFTENGSVPFDVYDNRGHLLKAYDLTITRPWQPHRVGDPNVGNSCLLWMIIDVGVRRPHQEWKWPDWVILSKKDLSSLTNLLRENEQSVWNTDEEMQRRITKLKKSIYSVLQGESYTKIAIYVNELLMGILELLTVHKDDGDKSLISTRRNVELFLSEISSNLSEQWTTESMANYCQIGTTSFIQYCKHLKNITPMQYLNQLRIDRAATLLLEKSELKVTDIAFECGFNSSQYFATVFRSHNGCTPKEYREKVYIDT